MTRGQSRLLGSALCAAALACGDDGSGAGSPRTLERGPRNFEPPVVTNAESPVAYPRTLYDQLIEGTVVLRLYVDETGRVVADSTRIAEGSGYAALDSAALAGVAEMRFAPARRNGAPVATAFLQPVHFRHPSRSGSGGAP